VLTIVHEEQEQAEEKLFVEEFKMTTWETLRGPPVVVVQMFQTRLHMKRNHKPHYPRNRFFHLIRKTVLCRQSSLATVYMLPDEVVSVRSIGKFLVTPKWVLV